MKLVEQFLSVQGEGLDIGKPMVFIRFAGCSLRCSWCDTKFSSWYSNEWYEKSQEEILEFLKQFNCKNISLTGGEPLIQGDLEELVYKLKEQDYYIDIQTNGIHIKEDLMGGIINMWSVSPKLQSSVSTVDKVAGKLQEQLRINFKVLERFKKEFLRYGNGMFKFVIEDKNDLTEVLTLLNTLKVKDIPIIFQPQGLLNISTAEYIKQLRDLVEEIIIKNKLKDVENLNLRILPQMHRLLWNNRRQI